MDMPVQEQGTLTITTPMSRYGMVRVPASAPAPVPVPVPVPAPAPVPIALPPRNLKTIKFLAIVQLVLGLIILVFGIAAFAWWPQHGNDGIWAGVWIMITGIIGIIGIISFSCQGNGRLNVCYIISCIISTIVTGVAGVILVSNVAEMNPEDMKWRCKFWSYYCKKDTHIGLRIYGTQLAMVVVEFGVSIAATIYSGINTRVCGCTAYSITEKHSPNSKKIKGLAVTQLVIGVITLAFNIIAPNFLYTPEFLLPYGPYVYGVWVGCGWIMVTGIVGVTSSSCCQGNGCLIRSYVTCCIMSTAVSLCAGVLYVAQLKGYMVSSSCPWGFLEGFDDECCSHPIPPYKNGCARMKHNYDTSLNLGPALYGTVFVIMVVEFGVSIASTVYCWTNACSSGKKANLYDLYMTCPQYEEQCNHPPPAYQEMPAEKVQEDIKDAQNL